MAKIFKLIKERLFLFIIGTITSLCSGLFASKVIFTIKEGLDDINDIDDYFLIRLVVYSVLSTAVAVGSTYFMVKITTIIVRKLTQSLSEKVLMANFEYVESIAPKIVPVLTREIVVLSDFTNKMPQFIMSVTTVLVTLSKMAQTNLSLTLLFLGIFSMQAMITILTFPYLKKFNRGANANKNILFKDLANLVSGLKELSLNSRRRKKYIANVITDDIKQVNTAQVQRTVFFNFTDKISELLVFLFCGFLMYFGIKKFEMDYEEFKTFLPTVLFLIPFTIKISAFFRHYNVAQIAIEQIEKLGVDIDNQKVDSNKQLDTTSSFDNPILTFENITFQYIKQQHEKKIVFGPLNLAINRNEITMIIGGNGSGKTTFSKIISGLYVPKQGQVYYKNQKIDQSNILAYRDRFSAYYTDSHVFEQLDHVNQEFMDKNAKDFISLLELDKKVNIKGDKFSTINLSFGQKSRLSLIANMLDDKEIYLFDEWAANQDPYFKSVFYYKILPYLKERGKTVIVISHDEKYFDIADNVIELKEGMVN